MSNHTERKHALLSASGASRWLNCTPSAKLEEGFDESSGSFAAEGTLAHELAELELRAQLLGEFKKVHYETRLKQIHNSELYSEEMDEEVDKYINFVSEEFSVSKKISRDAVILIEEKVDLSEFIEDGFGTCDSIIIADRVLKVIDLKYGKGVKVNADDNPQLKLYGLGALLKYELFYDISQIELTIVQPRLDHISTWRISTDLIKKWGELSVKKQAALAFEGKGDLKAGDWCRFCKAKPRCKKFAELNLELAKYEFSDPCLMDDKELMEVFNKMPAFEDWVKSVFSYLYDEALKGKKWEGLKLVEGKSNRKWLDESEVAKALLKNKFKPDDFMVSKLAGIGAIEKLTGKADFPKILGNLVIKPQGKPTLVPEDDKRPSMGLEQAQRDFQ